MGNHKITEKRIRRFAKLYETRTWNINNIHDARDQIDHLIKQAQNKYPRDLVEIYHNDRLKWQQNKSI